MYFDVEIAFHGLPEGKNRRQIVVAQKKGARRLILDDRLEGFVSVILTLQVQQADINSSRRARKHSY